MKKSKYNYSFEYNGKFYLFNPYSGLCELSSELFNLYNADINLWPNSLKEKLIRKKYVVDEIDEYNVFLIMRNRIVYSKNTLLLEIAPTLNCNCQCGYCFVSKKSQFMNIETQNNILDFIAGRILQGVRIVKVTWFGGEPLLAYQTISDLSKQIISLCAQHNVQYQAFLITNGILLNKEIVDNLSNLKIKGLQITLDGTEEFHNHERPCSHTNGFRQILNNLKLFTSNIKPVIRVNVSNRNCESICNLLYQLDEYSQFVKSVTFSPIFSINNTESSYKKELFDGKVFSEYEIRYIKTLATTKLKYEFFLKGKFVGDSAHILNYFCIDPNGNLYKSSFMLGNEDYIITNLKRFNMIDCFYSPNFSRYINNEFEKKCQQCFFLPYCVGGEASMISGKCDSIRYNFQMQLKFYIDCLNTNKFESESQ